MLLTEENINNWNNLYKMFSYKGLIPVAIQKHASRKLSTHITPVSNSFLLGIQDTNIEETLTRCLTFIENNPQFIDAIMKAQKTNDPQYRQKFNLLIYRSVYENYMRQDSTDMKCFYNIILNVTAPFLYDERKSSELNYDEWVKNCIQANPELNLMKDVKLISDRPFVLVQAFTGGFKNHTPYNKDTGSSIDITINLTDEDMVDIETFRSLIKYQHGCI